LTLIPRIVPCLLIEDGRMVKTRKFSRRTYLGSPVNVVNLFNSFEVDEIMLLDIGASARGCEPNVELIKALAEECWVPLAYGGGISEVGQIEQLIRLGCEKVVLGTSIATNLDLVRTGAREFGSQAIVGSIDAKRRIFGRYEVRFCGASSSLGVSPAERARQLEDAGVGEIILQSIDRDGEMNGYDLELIALVTSATNLPVVACGGAGRREELADPVTKAGASASAAGSLFVFSGTERGVLINFPERVYLESLFTT
jgi:cyclase